MTGRRGGRLLLCLSTTLVSGLTVVRSQAAFSPAQGFCTMSSSSSSSSAAATAASSSRGSASSMGIRPPTASVRKEGARLAAAERLMKHVYGDWDSLLSTQPHLFPKPMPPTEAGPSMVPYGDGGHETQRRYLWTDAFGLLNLCTLALRCGPGEENRRSRLLQAAAALAEAVQATLGRPRSPEHPMLAAETAGRARGEEVATPHGYVGLRIGKERARRGGSDAGMVYDGMYAHYTDKFVFALLRLGQTCGLLGDAEGEERYLAQAEQLVKAVHPHFMDYDRGGEPRGIYWKVNPDMSPIRGMEYANPNDDALAWWVVYSLVRHARLAKQQGAGGAGGKPVGSPIEREWREVDAVAGRYVRAGVRVSSDPLGYGLLGWKSQWMGPWAEAIRARLQVLAPMGVLDVETGMDLPFRLYGAIIGARLLSLSGGGGSPPGGLGTDAGTLGERALDAVTEIELADVHSPHSTINKAMLASALDPLALARFEGEPSLPMPGTAAAGGGEEGGKG